MKQFDICLYNTYCSLVCKNSFHLQKNVSCGETCKLFKFIVNKNHLNSFERLPFYCFLIQNTVNYLWQSHQVYFFASLNTNSSGKQWYHKLGTFSMRVVAVNTQWTIKLFLGYYCNRYILLECFSLAICIELLQHIKYHSKRIAICKKEHKYLISKNAKALP